MKILHIITDDNIGGAGRHLLAFLGAYDRECFTVEVALPEGSPLTPYVTALGVTAIELPFIATNRFSFKGLRKLYKLIGERKPDIVHTHASLAGRIAGRMRKRVVLNTRHYCIFEDELTPSSCKLAKFANNKLCNMVVAVSPEVEAGLRQQGTERVTTIFNGVPPLRAFSDEEKAAAREKYGIKPDEFVVAQVARMVELKGYDHTLDAAKILEGEAVFLFAGEGPHEPYLYARIDHEGINNVIFAGFVPEPEEIFNIADVLVSASDTEATALSILEAMSLGVPAVATDVGGVPFLINDGISGFLVRPRRGDLIADAILQLKDDPDLRANMSAAAKHIYEEFFTAERMAREMEELYRGLVSGKSSH